ncbi:class I SAM-dependent methyltransferase [Actinophytocola sp.]|uniref:SAM-dependent methyltransferase n=1 Tax=Actinophytocola sp. TaxID=1872138 RepID=UPI002D801303|nr:class I SAM-dependent methyltransferase [Actinophytocola sp.]HET9139752.1 class I SAM-dependent methyltransferase [Actinophytocola sp.]
MDRQEISALAHADHPVAAPLAEGAVDRLLAAAIRRRDARLLDLGCGAGAWLLRALRAHPEATAVGVDVSGPSLGRARAAAAAAGVAERIELCQQDVTAFRPDRPADVVLCVGAAHAFGELLAVLDAARGHLAPDGAVVLGDAFWEQEPDPVVRADLEDGPQRYADLATTVARVAEHGWTPVYGHVSTLAEWDEYEWCWTGSLARWALDHPDHPDREQVLGVSAEHRAGWLGGYRGVLGFVTLVLRRQ